jgi:hypothetical protein
MMETLKELYLQCEQKWGRPSQLYRKFLDFCTDVLLPLGALAFFIAGAIAFLKWAILM